MNVDLRKIATVQPIPNQNAGVLPKKCILLQSRPWHDQCAKA
jgi:hypothetical protein